MNGQMSLDEAASILRQLTRQHRALERLDELVAVALGLREAEQEALARQATLKAETDRAEKALLDLQAEVESCRENTRTKVRDLEEAYSTRRREIAEELGRLEQTFTGKVEAHEKAQKEFEGAHLSRLSSLEQGLKRHSEEAAKAMEDLDRTVAEKRAEVNRLNGEVTALRAQAQRIGRGE